MATVEEKRLSERVLELTENCIDPECPTCRLLKAAAAACDQLDDVLRTLGAEEETRGWTDDPRAEQDQVYREVTS